MWVALFSIVAGAGLIAWLGTGALIPLLRRRAVLDRPNERSLHQVPVPRGGGIAVVGAMLLAWVALIGLGLLPRASMPVLVGAMLLAAVSWIDDLRGLPPAVRLAAQIVAIGLVLRAGMPAGAVFQGWLPPALDSFATALLWVWFINLFNFMDGMDGLAGSEAAAIGLGLLLFAGVPLCRCVADAGSRAACPARSLMPERFRGCCPFGAPPLAARGLSRAVSSAHPSLPERAATASEL